MTLPPVYGKTGDIGVFESTFIVPNTMQACNLRAWSQKVTTSANRYRHSVSPHLSSALLDGFICNFRRLVHPGLLKEWGRTDGCRITPSCRTAGESGTSRLRYYRSVRRSLIPSPPDLLVVTRLFHRFDWPSAFPQYFTDISLILLRTLGEDQKHLFITWYLILFRFVTTGCWNYQKSFIRYHQTFIKRRQWTLSLMCRPYVACLPALRSTLCLSSICSFACQPRCTIILSLSNNSKIFIYFGTIPSRSYRNHLWYLLEGNRPQMFDIRRSPAPVPTGGRPCIALLFWFRGHLAATLCPPSFTNGSGQVSARPS